MSNSKKRVFVICAVCLVVLLLAVVGVIWHNTNENTTDPTLQPGTESTQMTTDGTETATTPDASVATEPQGTTAGTEPQATTGGSDSTKPTDPAKSTDPTKPADPSKPTDPTTPTDPSKPTEPSNPTDPTQGAEEEEPTTEPTEPPADVVIPVLEFPCEVPNHDLLLERLEPYSGLFVEDGSNKQVKDVAMLLVYNHGDTAVEYTEITVEYQDTTLSFHITALPAGEKMVVQEVSGKAIPSDDAQSASALVVHRAELSIAPEVTVTDNGDNSLTITNVSKKKIPTVRVFYKYYMEDEDLFVGGIAFTVRIGQLGPGSSIVVRPSHYDSKTSRVVMASVYDSET